MVEHLKQSLGWLFFFLIVAIPALAPEIFIAIGLVGWGITYFVLLIASIGADHTNTIPWMVVDPDRYTWLLLFLAMFVGLINGAKGVAGMFCFYAPLIFLPGFMLNIGLAVENRHGLDGHLVDNYNDPGCEIGSNGTWIPYSQRGDCIHYPKSGVPYPAFVTNRNGDIIGTR